MAYLTNMKIGNSRVGGGRGIPKLAFTYTVFVTVAVGGAGFPTLDPGADVVGGLVACAAVRPCELQ
jgi:hypothetical protein